jgi:hypothetical protein
VSKPEPCQEPWLQGLDHGCMCWCVEHPRAVCSGQHGEGVHCRLREHVVQSCIKTSMCLLMFLQACAVIMMHVCVHCMQHVMSFVRKLS